MSEKYTMVTANTVNIKHGIAPLGWPWTFLSEMDFTYNGTYIVSYKIYPPVVTASIGYKYMGLVANYQTDFGTWYYNYIKGDIKYLLSHEYPWVSMCPDGDGTHTFQIGIN